MAQLLDLCPEVLHNIFYLVDTADLASLQITCHFIHEFIKNDYLLWKVHYLDRFDPLDSFDSADAADASWRSLLTQNIAFERLLSSHNDSLKTDDNVLAQTCETVFKLLLNSGCNPTKNTEFLADLFTSESNISAFLCRSSLFQNCRRPSNTPAATEAIRQLSAKLHVYYLLALEPSRQELLVTDDEPVHPYARARVYDLRRYTQKNMWGPFMDDGSSRTDWEKVQSIMTVLSYNLRLYTERANQANGGDGGGSGHLWDRAFSGLAPHSVVSHPLSGNIAPPHNPELISQDPYGVTGTWLRIVCFLDYNDLYAFNFEVDETPIPLSQDRPPIKTREAFRLIRLQLRVTKIEDPGEGDKQDMPVVYFEGKSKSTFMAWDPNANSRIRGCVRTTPSGDIRWTTFSIFHGEERWRSEGVQIGGIQSDRGVLGNWFDKDYSQHGPAGPTAFWKISDDIIEDKKPNHSAWQDIMSVVFEQ